MTQRESAAMQIVYRYMAVSAGVALIPIAAVDVIALAGVHVSLIKRLCDHYEVDFSQHAARNILIGVLGSIIPGTVGSIVGRKVLGILPLAAAATGWVLMSASSVVFSYGIGRLFIRHFEAGGTLLNLDPKRMHHVFAGPRTHASPSAEPVAG